MSFGSFINDFADALNNGIRAFAKSEILPKAVGKTTRVGLDIGKTVGNLGFKVGMTGLNTGLNAANFIKDNHKGMAEVGKKLGGAFGREAKEWIHAGIGMAGKFDETFLKDVTLDKSILGKAFNKKGVALIAAGTLAMQGGREVKQYVDERQGVNDGQLYRTTPQMSTPYMLSEQMAYSSHGRSFADNAGATGDLVFALNNMRNG